MFVIQIADTVYKFISTMQWSDGIYMVRFPVCLLVITIFSPRTCTCMSKFELTNVALTQRTCTCI